MSEKIPLRHTYSDGEEVTEISVCFSKLLLAIGKGDADLLKEVIGQCSTPGVLLGSQDVDLLTPLHFLILSGFPRSEELIPVFVRNGANVSARDKLGRSALHFAALQGNAKAIDALVDEGADVNSPIEIPPKPSTTSQYCSCGGYVKCPARPWKVPVGVANVRETPLHWAVRHDHLDCAETLLHRGADVNAKDINGVVPILLVQQVLLERFDSMMHLLLEHEPRVNVIDPTGAWTPLMKAVTMGSIEVTRKLMAVGARVGLAPKGNEVLQSSSLGNPQLLNILLQTEEAKRLINRPKENGCTSLHAAAASGSQDCIQQLIDNGGDLSARVHEVVTVTDFIKAYTPNPEAFLRKCFDARVTANDETVDSSNFKLNLDFNILQPPEASTQFSVVSSLVIIPQLFRHPMIETFLRSKWSMYKNVFYFLTLCHLIFVTCFATYVLLYVYGIRQSTSLRWTTVMSAIILIMYYSTEIILIATRELMNFGHLESFSSLFTSLGVLYITITADGGINSSAPIAILFSFLNFAFFAGHYPGLGLYIMMTSTILKNFLKVSLLFLVVVLGFALSFAVQFSDLSQFDSIWSALVKTIVMVTGELEYSSLTDISRNTTSSQTSSKWSPSPFIGQLLLILFVLLILVVLMNLVVGLAVTDIQEIRNEGNIGQLKKQAEFLSRISRLECFLRSKIGRKVHTSESTMTISPNVLPNNLPMPLITALTNIALENRRESQSSRRDVRC